MPDFEHSGFSEGRGAVGSQKVSEPSVIPPKPEVVDTPSVATENPDSGASLVAAGAQEASEPASASDKPGVVDTAVVATNNLGLDISSFVAPPTSPNLAEPGVEPIRTGHSPSAPSSGPRQRTRQRSSRGGQTTRNHEAIRAWYSDLDTFRYWLYNNSGGKSGRGFWLGRYQLDQVHIDQKWQVANHEAITSYLTVTQCLVLAYNIWPENERWTYVNGLDRRRGVGHARQAVEADLLPPKRIINLSILGSENPPQEDWDYLYYNRYVGPNQQAKAKARAATPVGGVATVQPAATRVPQQPAAPKQPAVPSAGWQPALRSAQQSVQQAEHSRAHTSSSVRTPPTPKPVPGVAAPKERDTTVPSAEGPVSAPPSVVAKVVPKVEPVVTKSLPEPKQSQGVAVPKERDAAVVTSEESSTKCCPHNWCSPQSFPR